MQGEKLRKGLWHEEEDKQLITFVTLLGDRKWDYIARVSGIKRCGKSCRLRWLNYLRPNINHGDISIEEEQIILRLHEQWGNKWARIARSLPGRTDNEIKNYCRTLLRRKMQAREQENFQCGREDGKQDFLFQKVEFDVQTYESVDDTSGTSNTSLDALGFSSSAVTNSPYEVQFFDWVTELSNDQSKIRHQGGYNCTESSISYTARNSDDNDVWGWFEVLNEEMKEDIGVIKDQTRAGTQSKTNSSKVLSENWNREGGLKKQWINNSKKQMEGTHLSRSRPIKLGKVTKQG
ncbi:hypothetical protein LWI28_014220 [Acer negundo]|uniref:Uncharacterized protein n=1 Tax=Acer negundo TaxID=4023 RepID=A0AAD5I6S8_ACENE|nr:hypothetical protein LWI28_014220 [Acer negundo]